MADIWCNKLPRSHRRWLVLLAVLALALVVDKSTGQSTSLAVPTTNANNSLLISDRSGATDEDTKNATTSSSQQTTAAATASTTTSSVDQADLVDPTNLSQTTSTPKPVNWTLVEQEFEAVLSDEQVANKWHSMEQHFSDGIKSILKMIFPQIVAISQDAKVSGDCSGGILKWILNLRNLRSWAIKSKYQLLCLV